METEKTEGATVDTTNDGGEGEQESGVVTISKSEFEKLNQTIGSYKRQIKDLTKPKEETKETPEKTKSADDSVLLNRVEKMALRMANISHEDDVDLARKTAQKWGMDLEDVLQDDDFKLKLERQQTSRSNLEATSNIKGSNTASQAKNTPAYWISLGRPPSPTEVPDRKLRAQIARAMMANTKSGKKFYSD